MLGPVSDVRPGSPVRCVEGLTHRCCAGPVLVTVEPGDLCMRRNQPASRDGVSISVRPAPQHRPIPGAIACSRSSDARCGRPRPASSGNACQSLAAWKQTRTRRMRRCVLIVRPRSRPASTFRGRRSCRSGEPDAWFRSGTSRPRGCALATIHTSGASRSAIRLTIAFARTERRGGRRYETARCIGGA